MTKVENRWFIITKIKNTLSVQSENLLGDTPAEPGGGALLRPRWTLAGRDLLVRKGREECPLDGRAA